MPTIKEIAAKIGYSASTVSVVLSGKANTRKIPESTQQKVFAAAKELGYMPNISARRLRNSNYSNRLVVAVFWSMDWRASLVVRFLQGMYTEMEKQEREIEIIIRPFVNGQLHNAASLTELSMFNAAVIATGSEEDLKFVENTTFQIPIILYNRKSDHYCTVNVDNKKIGEMAANVFLSRGHKSSAIIASDSVISDLRVREDTFEEIMKENGVKCERISCSNNSMKCGYETALEVAKMPQLPRGIFCGSDTIAIGALKAFAKMNIKVPEDIEIISVGNGDREYEEYASTALSVVWVPMEKMAAQAVRVLWDVIDGKTEPPYAVLLPVEYIQRESCGGYLAD